MPDHVTNKIWPVPSDFLGTDNKGAATSDFDSLTPMPADLYRGAEFMHVEMIAKIALGLIDFRDMTRMPLNPLASGASMREATAVLERSNAVRALTDGSMARGLEPEEFEQMVAMMRSYRATGHLAAMSWCREMWGTKWGAYRVRMDGAALLFETAWTAPHPVIAALAGKVGSLVHEWADEDTGRNVGRRVYGPDGALQSETLLDDTRDGYELAFALHGDADNWRWNGTRYVYADDDMENA